MRRLRMRVRRSPEFVSNMLWVVLFSAAIGGNLAGMKILAFISLLALLAITGAVYTDMMFTSEQVVGQRAN
jgi:hypothetical protein